MQVATLMCDLVKTYQIEVSQSRSITTAHNPMSYLDLLKPQIIDFVAPCCAHAICEISINAYFSGIMTISGIK